VLRKVRNLENPGFTSFAFAFLIYGICEQLKLNGGIAVLAFGITVGNAHSLNKTVVGTLLQSDRLRTTERGFFSELVFLFGTLFFVLVGISIEFGQPIVYGFSLLIVAGIIFLRPVSIRLFANKAHWSFKDRAVMAVMAPKGLVPAILATLPIIEGNKIGSQALIDKGLIIKDFTFAVVLLSIFITAILVILLSSRAENVGFIGWMLGRDKIQDGEEAEGEESADGDLPVDEG
jgi:NhaP-type Na+/H+ or K+/H+ antiporter